MNRIIEIDLDFTRAELEDISKGMVTAIFEIQRLEDEKKEYMAIQNGKIKEVQADLNNDAELHLAGRRVVSVDCELRINQAKECREWIAKEASNGFAAGDIVSTEGLVPGDMQVGIEFPGEIATEDDDPFEVDDAIELPDPAVVNEALSALSAVVEEEIAAPDAPDEPFGDDDPFADDPVVSPFGAEVDGVEPPPFTMTPQHAAVLQTVRDHVGTDIISFEGADKPLRAAAEHLIMMGYIEGEDYLGIVALTKKGMSLFEAGYVSA